MRRFVGGFACLGWATSKTGVSNTKYMLADATLLAELAQVMKYYRNKKKEEKLAVGSFGCV